MSRFRRFRTVLRLGWLLFLRDFRMRYRQTYLGPLWAVARVVLTGAPLILVGSHFGLGGGRSAGEYVVFALVGLIIWQVFWDAVVSPQWVARRMRKMLTEAAFPIDAILVAGSGYVLFNTVIYLGLMAVALAIFRVPPPWTLPLGVVALPGLLLAGLALGVFFVPLTFVYLDFRYGLPFVSTALLWTAPIFYVSSPDQRLLYAVNTWNPLTYLIDVPRQWFVTGPSGHDGLFVACLAGFLLLLAAGLRFYRYAMPLAVERLPQR